MSAARAPVAVREGLCNARGVPSLQWSYLGRVEYGAARALQSRLAGERASGGRGDLLLLLEHPPVLTLGRNATPPAHTPLPVIRTDRGGDLTYHGPGQLVGYPVVGLTAAGRGVRSFIERLERALCRTAGACGVTAHRRAGLPGIWTGSAPDERKLASIGLAVRRGVTLHGCALNLDARAEAGFSGFDPCGLRGVRVTSLASEGAADVAPERIAPLLAAALALELGLEPVECAADELASRPHAAGAPYPATTDQHGHRPPP